MSKTITVEWDTGYIRELAESIREIAADAKTLAADNARPLGTLADLAQFALDAIRTLTEQAGTVAALREALNEISAMGPREGLYHGGESYFSLANRMKARADAARNCD